MSNNNQPPFLPVYFYPGGIQVSPLNDGNTIYKWVDPFGGGSLPGPIRFGTVAPTGILAHGGNATINNYGVRTIEYHYAVPTTTTYTPPRESYYNYW